MIAVDVGTYEVTFKDDPDTAVLVELTPWVLLEIERKWPARKADFTDAMPRWEGVLFAMWAGLDRPGNEDEFYQRLRSVRFLAADAADPSSPAASGDSLPG